MSNKTIRKDAELKSMRIAAGFARALWRMKILSEPYYLSEMFKEKIKNWKIYGVVQRKRPTVVQRFCKLLGSLIGFR